MRLQSIELIGFKSFADKTHLEFPRGITAIVGPNGCGKSNILDAIRWCLGEQSAKALRGQSMPDIIFSGTDSRPAHSLAEVSLTFTDCEPTLHGSFHEIRVTRRLFRDGSSEYEINRSPCRLRDIHQLFMDTGIGRVAYSIMEQGKITHLIQAKPEERRIVFEEAAGITKYKTQRKEALRKLESTQENLARLEIIIEEVRRQISSLQRQANKALRYQSHYNLLKELELKLARRHYQQLSDTISSLQDLILKNTQKQNELHRHLSDLESELASLRLSLQNTQTHHRELSHLHSAAIARAEQATQRHHLFSQRHSEALSWKERTTSEIAAIEEKIHNLHNSINSLRQQEASLLGHLQSASHQTQLENQHLSDIQNQLRTAHTQKQKLNQEILRTSQDIDQFRRELARLEALHHTTRLRLESLRNQQSQLELQFQELDLQRRNHSDRLTLAHQRVQEAEASLQAASETERRQFHTLQSLEAQTRTLQQNLKNKEGQLSAYLTLESSHSETSPIAQEILKAHKEGRLPFPILGTLSDYIHVHPGSEKPIATLLGHALHALLIENSTALETLRNNFSLSEKTHLILALIHEIPSTPPPSPLPDTAALHLVQTDPQAPPPVTQLIHRLLHHAHVARDLAHAQEIKKQHPNALIALQDGSVLIDSTGLVHFGADKGQAALTVLIRRNEIRRLELEIAEERKTLSELDASLINARALHTQAQHNLELARTTLQEARLHHAQAQADHDNAQSDVEEISRRRDDYNREISHLLSQQQTHHQQEQSLQTQLQEATQALKQSQDALQNLEQQILQLTETETQARDRLSAALIQQQSLEQQHLSLKNQIHTAHQRLEELQTLLHTRHSETKDHDATIQEASQAIQEAERDLTQAQHHAQQYHTQIQDITQKLHTLQNEISTREQQQLRLRNELESLQHNQHQHEIQLAEARIHLQNHREKILTTYQTPLDELTPLSEEELNTTPWSEIQTQVQDLKQKIQAIGAVNPEAITEFQELQDRYNFLTAQQQDLLKSKQQLLQTISEINLTTQKLFTETFEKIRTHFQSLFQQLFNGGKAHLELLQHEDPLESGIEIIARPPGKKPQSITLLSGGEQTLTALALLFALYKVKPSPFCVLDEMDAPLDESNIDRFIAILKNFTEHSQFIVITHNKRTIQAADVVYGVTMHERGISRILSLKIHTENPHPAPSPPHEATPRRTTPTDPLLSSPN
ncbi:MAG: chromosome segregation protein SMC [Verrucomicrobiae bacterium]|nr:chromosome segregation protein SMC [Verrucomicrobiae bacterium]